MRLSIWILFMLVFSSGSVLAQSSWEKLINEIEKPVMGDEPGKGQLKGNLLKMPDMSVNARSSAEENDQKSITFVTSYKCVNPDIPDCLWNMRSKPGRVDLENCRDITRSYLQNIASYNRCVDRRARKHARHVVKFFNCYADKRQNCPGFFVD